MPTWLDHFERLKEYHAKDEVFTPVMILRMRTCSFTVFSEANTRLSPDCLEDYPRLKLFKEVVEAIPSVSEYIKSARRPRHVNGNSAFLDNPKNPIDNNDEEKNEL